MAGVGQTKTASLEPYISGTRASSWQAARVAARSKKQKGDSKGRNNKGDNKGKKAKDIQFDGDNKEGDNEESDNEESDNTEGDNEESDNEESDNKESDNTDAILVTPRRLTHVSRQWESARSLTTTSSSPT